MSIRETLRSIIKGRPAQIGEVRRWANGTFRKTSDGWQEVSQNLDRLNRKDALQQRRRERNRENARRLEHRISVLQEWADDPEKAAEAWKGYPEVQRFGAPAAVKAELKLAKKLLRHYKLDRSAENKGKKEYLDDMRDILRSEAEDRVRGRYAGIIDRMQGRLDELDERIGGDANIVKVSDDQLTHYRTHGVPEGILLHGSEKPLGSLSTGFSDTGDVYLTNSVSVAQNYGDHIYATRIKGRLVRFDDPDDRVLNAILKESGRLTWVPERIRDAFDDGNKTEALDFVRHVLSQTDYHESPMDDVELQNILGEYGYVGAVDGRGRTTVVWDDESLAAPGLSADETVERESLSDRIESAEARMESAVERELARVDSMIDGMDQESLERQVDRVFARENSGPLGRLLVKHPNESRYDDVSKRLKTIEADRRKANTKRNRIGKRLQIQRSVIFTIIKGTRAQVGESRTWKNGTFQKQSDGSWKKVNGGVKQNVVSAAEGVTAATVDIRPDKYVPADYIEALHGVRDREKLEALVRSMKEKGWSGPPILIKQDDKTDGLNAWTGSHRIRAAEIAQVDVPIVIFSVSDAIDDLPTEEEREDAMHDLDSMMDDEDRLRWVEKYVGERSDAAALLRLEVDNNRGPSIRKSLRAVLKARPVKYFKRIPTGNPKRPWRYFYNEDEWKTYEKKQKIIQAAVQEARESPHGPETIGDLTVDVHGKAIVVRGETKKHVDLLRTIRETLGIGGWNDALKAWVFPGSRRAEVVHYLKEGLLARSARLPPVADFVRESLGPAADNEQRKLPLWAVDQEEAQRLFAATGLDLRGYTHVLENYALKHIVKEHGNAATEASRGQTGITPDDLALIPEILRSPDSVRLSTTSTGIGLPAIIYEKKIGGKVTFVEEVRTGKRELVPKSMYKVGGGESMDPEGPPLFTSETTPPPVSNIDLTGPERQAEKPGAAAGSSTSEGRKAVKEAIAEVKESLAPALADLFGPVPAVPEKALKPGSEKEIRDVAVDDYRSEHYRFADTGYIAGSRKEAAASMIRRAARDGKQVAVEHIDWSDLEKNPREAEKVIVKAHLFGEVDWSGLKDKGMEPAAGFLVSKIYGTIPKAPAESTPAARYFYTKALGDLRLRMESRRTVAEVVETLEEIRQEFSGATLSEEEQAEYDAITKEYQETTRGWQEFQRYRDASWKKVQDIQKQIYDYERIRQRRRGKLTPEEERDLARLNAARDQAREDHINDPKLNELKAFYEDTAVKDGPTTYFTSPFRKQRAEIMERAEKVKNAARERHMQTELYKTWASLGSDFFSTMHFRRNPKSAFARHVTAAKSGSIRDWSWMEKGEKAVKQPTKESVRFQLKVAENFDRKGGRPVTVSSTKELKETFRLRDIQSGNWVLRDMASAQFHTQKTAESFADLADILQIDDHDISLGGELAMAFGARGRGGKFGPAPVAHYESVHRVINLTKMGGGGSLAHEWFHAMDNLIAAKEGKDWSEFASDKAKDIKHPLVRDKFTALMEAMLSGDVPETTSVPYTPEDVRNAPTNIRRRFANPESMTPEEMIRQVRESLRLDELEGKAFKQMSKYEKKRIRNGQQWIGLVAAYFGKNPAGGSLAVPTGKMLSSFVAEARLLDSGKKTYWSSEREMAARAFQSYVEDKLSGSGRKNGYLSSMADNLFYRFEGVKPFPEGTERQRINRAFDELFAAMRSSGYFKEMRQFGKSFFARIIKSERARKAG